MPYSIVLAFVLSHWEESFLSQYVHFLYLEDARGDCRQTTYMTASNLERGYHPLAKFKIFYFGAHGLHSTTKFMAENVAPLHLDNAS